MEYEDRRHFIYVRWRRRVFSVGDIDFVMCTHLHVDHVGMEHAAGKWPLGTDISEGALRVHESEFDYWTEQNAKTPVPPFGDSVLPIVEAKRAEIVRNDYRIGDMRAILPTAGSHARTCRVHLRPRQG